MTAAPSVVVVGLGPGDPALVPTGVMEAIGRVSKRFVRTSRHPSASVVGDAATFDPLYETAATLDDVYAGIVEALVAAAVESGEALYAVPGSPAVAERSVELLRNDPRVAVDVILAPSFLDLAWDRLGVDPVAAGVRIIDGQRFATEAASERGPMLVAQCDTRAVLSEVKLAFDDVPPASAIVLQRLGLADERLTRVAWADLDREIQPDHLTCLYIESVAAPVGNELARLTELVRMLRERCPWDREQTHASLTRHVVEEAYEVVEAIDALETSGPDHLREELGDLLFQVYFHANLATEAGEFTLADVARGVHDKLVRRHPHVFGDVAVSGPGEVLRNWEQLKREEKGRESVMDGIPAALPALARAQKAIRKAASTGRTLDADADIDAADIGSRLFALAREAVEDGVDAESALRSVTGRAIDRFRAGEGADRVG